MITNNLKIAWRNLLRNKGFTLINVLGLSVGMACFLLILMYVNEELGYDSFHAKGDRIYRMALERKYPGRSRSYAMIPMSYGEAVTKDIPGVEDYCRLFNFGPANMIFRKGNESWNEDFVTWADSSFFNFFDIPLLVGDPKTALGPPNSIVLTESMAEKYFGSNWQQQSLIGETMDLVQNDNDLRITGICADVPENSHLRFDFLVSSQTLGFIQGDPNYLSFSAITYLLLNEQTSPEQVEAKLPDLVVKYASGQVLTNFGVDYATYQKNGNGYLYTLQPLPDIYLDSHLEGEMKPPGSRQRIYFFSLIALLIIVIAGINFMNLATARSTGRAREVGIRKTLGSERGQLVMQFLTEAVMISTMAAGIAAVFVAVALPWFNDLTDKTFVWQTLFSPFNILVLLVLALLTGLASGFYPAVFMSSFKPIQVLRGKLLQKTKGIGLRNLLVVFQFTISIFLIAATILIYKQMDYTQSKALGFDKESLVTIQNAAGMGLEEAETFKKEIAALPGVVAASGCNSTPGGFYFGVSFRPPETREMTTGSGLVVSEGYVECMKMEMTDGREFSTEFMDTLSIIVNEAAVQEMGIEDPIGKRLVSNDNFLNPNPDEPSYYTIVGVLKNFHFQSLHHKISPLFLIHRQRAFPAGVNNLVSVRMAPGETTNTLQQMETIWKKFQPELPFSYLFMDREWANLYTSEMAARRVFIVFTVLAIVIACLGLFGLAAFIVERRTKEVGIRKVLGASTSGIITLLSKDFLKLVGIAILIASPIAYFFMDQWLQDFAYRINIPIWVFVVAGFSAVLIAFITVSFQSMKAALTNPVKALRSE